MVHKSGIKECAFRHLFDFTPSVILARHLGIEVPENPSEEDWKLWESLSLIPPEPGKLTLNCGAEIVLKHPISAAKKELKALKELICNKDKETIRQLLKELRRAELELRDEALNGERDIDGVWNGLPDFLEKMYIPVLKKYFLQGIAERIAEKLVHFPADPAFPDHDWLSRAEFYSTIRVIEEAGEKPYLLRFKISPVQGFIGNARKERDFWAGSHLLSTLTYIAIEEIMREAWPWAVIFPHLRGQPVFERGFKQVEGERLKIPNMPNKVLAVIGLEVGERAENRERELENEIRSKIETYLKNLFEEAWEQYGMDNLVEKLGLDPTEEKKEAKKALENYFYITVALWPYEGNVKVFDKHMRAFLKELEGFEKTQRNGGEDTKLSKIRAAYVRYPYLFAVLDQKTEFKSNEWEKAGLPDGFKCTVCGELPAIGQYSSGKPGYKKLRDAWREHSRELPEKGIHDIREDEMLCPLCLVKRWYGKKENYRVESVSEIAIRKSEKWNEFWLVAAEEKSLDEAELTDKEIEALKVIRKLFQAFGKNSEVLYTESASSEKALAKVYGISAGENNGDDRPEKVRDRLRASSLTFEDVRSVIEALSKAFGEPPKYYAMLKMDGDNMGKVISGEKGMREVKEYLHPKIAKINRGSIFEEKRPVNPPVHVAITRSLSKFAVEKVREIVSNNKGELILAGGDDILALFPTDTPIKAAYKLQETFRMDWDKKGEKETFDYLQGKSRSMSAGLLVAYYKEPLYHVYDLTSDLEHLAKESGRNAIAIGYLTHSGNFYRVVANWEVFSAKSPLWEILRGIVSEGEKSSTDFTISSRFIYELFEDVENWPNDPEAIVELLRFEIGRHVGVKDSSRNREILEKVLQGILCVASHMRVKVSAGDYVDGSDVEKKREEKKLGECITELLAINPEEGDRFSASRRCEKTKEERTAGEEPAKFWKKLADELSLKCNVKLAKSPTELAGEIMKKQLKDTAMLIRILRRMNAREVGE